MTTLDSDAVSSGPSALAQRMSLRQARALRIPTLAAAMGLAAIAIVSGSVVAVALALIAGGALLVRPVPALAAGALAVLGLCLELLSLPGAALVAPLLVAGTTALMGAPIAAATATMLTGTVVLLVSGLRDGPALLPVQLLVVVTATGLGTVTARGLRRTWRPRRRRAPTLELHRKLARAAMTERRLLEVATNLRATQIQLEADMRQREAMAEQLTIALQRADAANRAKGAFLATMSHELRTPLNSIIGFSTLLLRNAGPTTTPTARAWMERINRSGRHLLALINDILDLSRIESGRMSVTLDEVELGHLLRDLVELQQPLVVPQVELRLELPPGPLVVTSDTERLRQVLLNLLSNALKFTREGHVTARVVLDDAGAPTRIEVEDTGIGITPDRLDAIFEPFVQANNSTSREYGGTGLGLAISRQLCAMLDVRLEVASTPGRGTTFTLHLPASRGPASTLEPSHLQTPVPEFAS